jgi:hypothetical protein
MIRARRAMAVRLTNSGEFVQRVRSVHTSTGSANTMPSWDGFGEWNVPWAQWQAGNLLKNH